LRSRCDPAAIEPGNDKLNISLGGATDSRIGDLGEETAAVFLDDAEDATIVTMGDSRMQPPWPAALLIVWIRRPHLRLWALPHLRVWAAGQ